MVAKKIYLNGLGCANCAMKIENKVDQLPYTDDVSLNFSTSTLKLQLEEKDEEQAMTDIRKIVRSLEPDVQVEDISLSGGTAAVRHDACGSDHCEAGHEYGDSHEQEHKGSKAEEKNKTIFPIIGAVILLIAGIFLPLNPAGQGILLGAATLLCGWEVLYRGIKSLFRLNFEENLLMTVAVIAAFVIGEYMEATLVMLLFTLGEYIEGLAVAKSRRDISELTNIRPDTANLLLEGGQSRSVPAENVQLGQLILVKAGERIPLDCRIRKGTSMVDTSAMTGESLPVSVAEGDSLLSGTINQSGLLECEVTSTFANSAASRVVELVEESVEKKGSTEKLITKFARIYTPIVMAAAVLLAVVPPLLGLGAWSEWISRSLVFLVASCPCAFVIAVPLGFYSAIGSSSKLGVLVKGGKYLEVLSKTDTVVLDKTGTLTSGKLKVSRVNALAKEYTEDEITRLCAVAESYSNHPIAKSVVEYYGSVPDTSVVESYTEQAGMGVEMVMGGDTYLCGSSRMLSDRGISTEGLEHANIYLVKNSTPIGQIFIEDQIKENSKGLVKGLEAQDVGRVVMLTGDGPVAAKAIADVCGIEEYHHSLLPEGKVEKFEKIKEGSVSLFVGDGINDAPALAMADAGVSIGLGSDIAIESSDVVLMSGDIGDLPRVIALAKRSMKTIRFLIAFAITIKLAVLLLGAAGIATMWMAVFADVGVSIIAVFIASRIMGYYKTI